MPWTLAKVGLRERAGEASALGIDAGWLRWSSSSDTGVLYLVWNFSDRGVSVILATLAGECGSDGCSCFFFCLRQLEGFAATATLAAQERRLAR